MKRKSVDSSSGVSDVVLDLRCAFSKACQCKDDQCKYHFKYQAPASLVEQPSLRNDGSGERREIASASAHSSNEERDDHPDSY